MYYTITKQNVPIFFLQMTQDYTQFQKKKTIELNVTNDFDISSQYFSTPQMI